jgi:hypothetical protein
LAGESVKSEQSYFLAEERVFLVDSLHFLAECSEFLAGDELYGINNLSLLQVRTY